MSPGPGQDRHQEEKARPYVQDEALRRKRAAPPKHREAQETHNEAPPPVEDDR